jgi:probable phosphoglycerate mutase
LLVVAHDAVNRVILCKDPGPADLQAVDLPPGTDHAEPARRRRPGQLEVVRLNDCAHHTPFFGEAKHRAL